LYIYAINYSPQSKQEIEELFYEGNLAAKQILSEEYPGIITDKKINQTKLEEFSTTDYNSLKIMLGITHDFYFKFEGLELEGISTEYVGRTNSSQINNIVKTTRLSIYKNKPIKFEIFIWD